MQNVILAIHIIACVVLIGVILLQRSEGGALGMGGGGDGGGGLMSGRGAAGALVRTTMIFATVFFITTLTLTTMANRSRDAETVVGGEAGPAPLDIRNTPDAPLFEDTPTVDEDLIIDPLAEEIVPDTPTDPLIDPLEEQTPVENTP